MRKAAIYSLLIMVIFASCDKEEADVVSDIISELQFLSTSESKTITFSTNKTWETSILNNDSWLSVSPLRGSAGNVDIIVTVSENTGYDDRETTLTVETGNTVKNVEITQRQKDEIIISDNKFNFNYEGGTFEVKLSTNVELNISIPEDVNWVHYQSNDTRALTDMVLKFKVDENTSNIDREALITIGDNEGKFNEIITVIQDENNFKDSRDGRVYTIVTIGEQTWMAENLAYLPAVSASGTGSNTDPHYYVLGYNGISVEAAKATVNYTTYGVLYNWVAAMGEASSSSSDTRVKGICPDGWHLPNDAEWTQLTDCLGGESVAGGKLRETGTTHWGSPNNSATNESGFTALPGGYRYNYGTFHSIGSRGHWWSATEYNSTLAWYRLIYYNKSDLDKNYLSKGVGFSVRCVRD